MLLRCLAALALAMAAQPAAALQNGVARRPPLGWSTWLSFRLNVSEALLKVRAICAQNVQVCTENDGLCADNDGCCTHHAKTSADFLAASPLKAAGYEYILLDDGWPTCAKADAYCIFKGRSLFCHFYIKKQVHFG